MNNRTDSPEWRHFRESHVIDGEPETAVSASLQKIKSIKNHLTTSDSFVNHSMVILHT